MRGETPPDPEEGWGALHQMSHDDSDASTVRLAAVQEQIERVLERTGMLRLFATHPSRDDAVAALRGA
jgi:anti-anti-sigma regulatory factor